MKRLLFSLAVEAVVFAGMAYAANTRIVFTSDDSLRDGSVCNTNVLNQFVDSVLALNPRPQMVIHGGDMIDKATNSDGFNCFRLFTNIIDRLVTNGIPYCAGVGNHDPSGDTAGWYAKWTNAFYYLPTNGPAQWSRLAYYVDVGSCRLVFLDSITGGTNSPGAPPAIKVDPIERTWLRSVIGTNSPAEFDCAITHIPAYITNLADDSLGDHEPDGDDFLQALMDAKVSVFFCGHNHNPSRRMIDARYNPNWIRTVPQIMDVMGSQSDGGESPNYPLPEFWADSTAMNTNTFTVLDLDPAPAGKLR